MQKGRGAEAETAFKRAVEVDSTSVVAQLALANFYWSTGRMPDAEAPLKRAVELDPSSAIGQRALSTFYTVANRPKDAEAPLKNLAAESGRHPGAADPGRLLRQTPSAWTRRSRCSRSVAKDRRRLRRRHAAACGDRLHAEADRRGASQGRRGAVQTAQEHAGRHHEGPVPRDGGQDRRCARAGTGGRRRRSEIGVGPIHARHACSPARNQLDEAIGAFNEVIKLNPRVGGVQVRLAELQLRKGAAPAAVQFAEQAVRDTPEESRRAPGAGALAGGDGRHGSRRRPS